MTEQEELKSFNCASGICCPPKSPQALAAMTALLCALGLTDEHANVVAGKMRERGWVILPASFAREIRRVAFGPDTPQPVT
jgi:hypothetical protein